MERQAYSKVMWTGSPWFRNGGYGKGDGLNLSSRPRKGNVHTRPPLLCRVALSYASAAPTSSSKRRLDQLPSRCSIALVAFRVKILELSTPVSPSIHYLLKHCLPLRTWPGVDPARYSPFTYMQINQAIMLFGCVSHFALKQASC